jgi:hypothetical protein
MLKTLVRSATCLAALLAVTPAWAKTVTVKVDSKSMPWDLRANRTLRYGLNDGRPPVIVTDPAIKPGGTITITATGSTVYVRGGRSFGPDGDSSWPNDRGNVDYFPSHHMKAAKDPIFLGELVGAFISGDGVIVGSPFPIGRGTKVVVPTGAAGISMGLNDDAFFDNSGTLSVAIDIPVASVTVEDADAKPAAGGATGAATSAPATPATVQRVSIALDAATAPWDPVVNAATLPIGAKGAKPPVVVPITVPAGKAVIFAEGTTDTAEATGIGVIGNEKKTVNDTPSPDGQRYPSFYVPKLLYPAYRHGLVAVFVDAKGAVVSRPFMVGKGVRLPNPDTAAGLALGFNDVDFAGNTGTLHVTVELPPQQ